MPCLRLGRILHDELLAFERGDRLVERRRHGQFASWRRGTSEWFEASPELSGHVRRLAAGVEDP